MSQVPEQPQTSPPSPQVSGLEQTARGNGLALTALIIAIVSLLLCLIPIVNNASFFLGLLALVLGIVGVILARGGRRRGKSMAIIAIVLSVLSLGGVLGSQVFYGKALDEIGKSIDPDTTSSKAGAESGTTQSTQDPAPDADRTYKVGDTVQVKSNGETAAEIVVSKATSSAKAFDSYAEKPQNGRYKHLTVAVKNVGQDGFDFNPYDWYLRDTDGTKYQYGEGNYSGWNGKQFNSGTLAAGERVQGTIEFDAPAEAKVLIYAPGSDAEATAIWKIS